MTMFFTSKDGTTPISNPLQVHAAGGATAKKGKRIYLTNAGEKFGEIQLETTNANSASATLVRTPFDTSKGQWTVDLHIHTKGQATIKATRGAEEAKLVVNVSDRIGLPTNEPNAMLVRLFLAESPTPDDPGYSAAEVRQSMEWMRIVLENRRSDPKKFKAENSSLLSIVKAPNQIKGFESYPTIQTAYNDRIETILKRSNDDDHPKRVAYDELIQMAISVAAAAVTMDPCPSGLYGWRTVNSGSPGPDFVECGQKAGNQFYTLQSKKAK